MDFAESVLTELPLFPLQSVLFPGGLLPLRIFEVRYLDMIGRAHRDGTPFGVVSLTDGAEVRRAPAQGSDPGAEGGQHDTFHAIGTLAHITELTRPQPGLMMIRCTGGSRFRLKHSEQLRHGLWVGHASLLPADADMSLPEDLRVAEQTLQQLVRQVREQVGEAALPLQGPWRWDDCGWVANRWCELLPLETAQKQRLMELDSPLLRLELVVDELKRLKLDQRLAPD